MALTCLIKQLMSEFCNASKMNNVKYCYLFLK